MVPRTTVTKCLDILPGYPDSVSLSDCGNYYAYFDSRVSSTLVIGHTQTDELRRIQIQEEVTNGRIVWESVHNNCINSIKVAIALNDKVIVLDVLNTEFKTSIQCPQLESCFWMKSRKNESRRDVLVAQCGDDLKFYEFDIWKGDYRKSLTLNLPKGGKIEQKRSSDIFTAVVREGSTDIIQNYALIDPPHRLALATSTASNCSYDIQDFKWSPCGNYLLVIDSPLRGLSTSLFNFLMLSTNEALESSIEDFQMDSLGSTCLEWGTIQGLSTAFIGTMEEDVYVYKPGFDLSMEFSITHRRILTANQNTVVWKQRTTEPLVPRVGLTFQKVQLDQNSIQPNIHLGSLERGVQWMKLSANSNFLYTRVNSRPDGLFIWDLRSRHNEPLTAIITMNAISQIEVGVPDNIYDLESADEPVKNALGGLLMINDGISISMFIEGLMKSPLILETKLSGDIEKFQISSCKVLGAVCVIQLLAWDTAEVTKLEVKFELEANSLREPQSFTVYSETAQTMGPPSKAIKLTAPSKVTSLKRPLHVLEQLQNTSPQVETDDDTTVRKLASDVQKREWFNPKFMNRNLGQVVDDNDTFVNKKKRLEGSN
ncbi:unnamed protein product [Kuraishia capsulata CBS 1993]|uniref:Eukaryotic translation initiation factor 2A n=1 Tax=Kuraishia capsulata CBS 1993 TaxID=1382522 RepID=W6MTM0_9ASCO|nr:uncharacterized protein KUCA_T00001092001 [Kuraishia capsulata CBS 1993]CDK25125.1 unnamed protein product [Kuraishia capsulata CBS 1993]